MSKSAFKLASMIVLLGASVQIYAADPVRLVVAFPPGGPADQLARIIAAPLEKELKNNVIVENKPGANGAIAASYVAKSPKNGSVLFFSSVGAIAINPSLYPKLIYDPVSDLAPISLVASTAEILVVPPIEAARNASEFVAHNRNSTRPPSLASSGVGSMPHMAIEQFIDSTGINYLHVAYKGAAPAITDTIGGQVNGFIGDAPGVLTFIKSGRLKALGVAADKRLPFLPDVQTLKEQGIRNVEAINWYGVLAPAGTPKPIMDALNKSIYNVMSQPEMKAKMYAIGAEPMPGSEAEFAAVIKRDIAKWSAIIKAKHIKPE